MIAESPSVLDLYTIRANLSAVLPRILHPVRYCRKNSFACFFALCCLYAITGSIARSEDVCRQLESVCWIRTDTVALPAAQVRRLLLIR